MIIDFTNQICSELLVFAFSKSVGVIYFGYFNVILIFFNAPSSVWIDAVKTGDWEISWSRYANRGCQRRLKRWEYLFSRVKPLEQRTSSGERRSEQNPHFDPRSPLCYLRVNSALTLSRADQSTTATALTASPGRPRCARYGREGLARLSTHGAISHEPDS